MESRDQLGGDVAPVAGDDLVFPAGAARLVNTNNLASGTAFNSVTLSGSNVISGNSIPLNFGLKNNGPSGTTNTFTSFTPASNATVRCFANTTLNLPALGTGTNINFLLGTTIVSSGIVGSGDVQKTGAGLLIFSAANFYSGVHPLAPRNVHYAFFGRGLPLIRANPTLMNVSEAFWNTNHCPLQ